MFREPQNSQCFHPLVSYFYPPYPKATLYLNHYPNQTRYWRSHLCHNLHMKAGKMMDSCLRSLLWQPPP